MIIKLCCALLGIVIAPILVGFFISKFIKNEKSIIYALVVGYLVEFAICELIAVPMIFLKCTFKMFLLTYIGIIFIISIASIILNFKDFKEILLSNIKSLKETPKILTIICIFLVCIQIYVFAFYSHLDWDDAFYVSSSVTTVQTNSLYKYDPETGVLNR